MHIGQVVPCHHLPSWLATAVLRVVRLAHAPEFNSVACRGCCGMDLRMVIALDSLAVALTRCLALHPGQSTAHSH
eukprot:4583185-Amphidinium_carterae.1